MTSCGITSNPPKSKFKLSKNVTRPVNRPVVKESLNRRIPHVHSSIRTNSSRKSSAGNSHFSDTLPEIANASIIASAPSLSRHFASNQALPTNAPFVPVFIWNNNIGSLNFSSQQSVQQFFSRENVGDDLMIEQSIQRKNERLHRIMMFEFDNSQQVGMQPLPSTRVANYHNTNHFEV